MLRLFRHIRKRLFIEGRVSRYFGYAVGEIVLIVVGILIALQISNWNQARIEAKERRAILVNLREDLAFQKSAWEENIWWLEQREEATQSLFNLLYSQNTEEDRGKTVEVMLLAGYITEFQPSFPSYEEIKGSGKLSLIKSVDLKKKLSEYEAKIDIINSVYRAYNGELKVIEKKVMSQLGDTPEAYLPILQPIPDSHRSMKFDREQLAEDEELFALLKHSLYYTLNEKLSKKGTIIRLIDESIEFIEAELTNP